MDESLRRKIIKGSLSAPLVLTVGRAHATVAQTTFGACRAKTALEPQPAAAVGKPDNAMRVTRDVFEATRVTNGRRERLQGRYVVGFDNQTLYRLDGDGVAPPMSRANGLDARALDVELAKSGKVEVLAYLDGKGNVVGIAPQPNNGFWTTKSCYASFMGMPKEPRRWWG